MGTKKLIIANWKMNLNIHEASIFLHKLSEKVENHRDVEVVLAPTMLALQPLSLQVNHRAFKLAAQNFYWRDNGPFTGEVSANQLRGLIQYGLVGHSERRHVFHEREKDIRLKVQAAFRNQFVPVLCIGETASERADGETKAVIHDQLVEGLSNITSQEASQLVVAYEPVWAISNGKDFATKEVPTPGDATKIARIIRDQVKHLFGQDVADKIRVLYGASVNPDNAAGFLSATGIDGVLVGGASLDVNLFSKILEISHSVTAQVDKA